jgi:glutathione synthase/RimK-type ligase-like ATP-grasp enzyme
VVGDRLLEVNAWSPGGLTDAGRFQGVDFTGAVIDALEQAATT